MLPEDKLLEILKVAAYKVRRKSDLFEIDELINIAFCGRIRDVDNPAFAFKCAFCDMIDAIRHNLRHHKEDYADISILDTCSPLSSRVATALEDSLHSKVLLNDIFKKAELSQQQRDVIYYIFYQGYTYAQTAAALNVKNESAVGDMLHKALKSLKAAAEEMNEEKGKEVKE